MNQALYTHKTPIIKARGQHRLVSLIQLSRSTKVFSVKIVNLLLKENPPVCYIYMTNKPFLTLTKKANLDYVMKMLLKTFFLKRIQIGVRE